MLEVERVSQPDTAPGGLDFIWLELTNQCNLQCVHCYAESGPRAVNNDIMEISDYMRVIDESFDIGCRMIQFIGGEPTLNNDLSNLIIYADRKGFEFIEVFTNLTRLTDSLATLFKERRVHVATSVYADVAGIHDKITTVPGSFARTISNLKKLIAIGVFVRASVIAMQENRHVVEETINFLQRIGVQSVGSDGLRKIGRGAASGQGGMSELCGQCAGPKLCIGPDGLASPCIMSKSWSVGSVMQRNLVDIIKSNELAVIRSQIADATRVTTITSCNPNRPNPCNPDYGGPCGPCNPNTHCGPNACRPV